MRLVECEEQYWEFVYHLRFNLTNKNFIQQNEVSISSHNEFMTKYSADYRVCLNSQGDPIGFIGQVGGDMRIAILPSYQGLGIGSRMIQKFAEEYPNSIAKIKSDNIASIQAFEKAGFKKKYYILER